MKSLVLGFVLTLLVSYGHETHTPAAAYQSPQESLILGEQPFQYRLLPDWGKAVRGNYALPNCHDLAATGDGRILLLVDDPKRCVIVMDAAGVIVDEWGDFTRKAHGLSIVREAGGEVCYITDNAAGGQVFKTTLDGEVLMTLGCPMASGLYKSESEYKPSKTLHFPNGEFAVLDGYGKDFVHMYSAKGVYLRSFGGTIGEGEARLKHWGPHGGAALGDQLLLALSDQQALKLFKPDGTFLKRFDLPGSNPRTVVPHRGHLFVPHLGDAWPKDRNAAGYISILDADLKVVGNLGAAPPRYVDDVLQPMAHNHHVFRHPHGMCFDWQGNLYVAQFASNGSWPLKFQPVPATPPEVRFIYLLSADREENPAYTKAIRTAARQVQGWVADRVDGATFRIAKPEVEILRASLSAAEITEKRVPGISRASWGFHNCLREMQRLKGDDFLVPHETVWVIYSDGPGNSGRAFPGFVYLPEDDLLGLLGKHPTQKDFKRWQGGLMHELGHGLGLIHPFDIDKHRSAIMWAGFYGTYPDGGAYLTESDKVQLRESVFLQVPPAAPPEK